MPAVAAAAAAALLAVPAVAAAAALLAVPAVLVVLAAPELVNKAQLCSYNQEHAVASLEAAHLYDHVHLQMTAKQTVEPQSVSRAQQQGPEWVNKAWLWPHADKGLILVSRAGAGLVSTAEGGCP